MKKAHLPRHRSEKKDADAIKREKTAEVKKARGRGRDGKEINLNGSRRRPRRPKTTKKRD